ncbi:MAG: flagellar basal body L-ring protein FlgH [Alphaproteobacteria bacterium]
MRRTPTPRAVATAATLAVSMLALGGCNALNRLANVGEEPPLTQIENPTQAPGYRSVSMPMPAPRPVERNANSLWRTGSRAFFKDQRANDVGDILTVLINLNDSASISNETSRSRTAGETAGLPRFLGFETELDAVLPDAINPATLVDATSNGNHTGTGSIEREEQVTLRVAAVVTQVLPNGNYVIHGRQEVRVNFEKRELQVAGVIRPEDITSTNTIDYDRVAEARVAYGGRGQITDVQQPRYGQQVFDIIFPF